MLTHVKDHLTGDMIPVRYIEDGPESLSDCLASSASLAACVDAANAELDAIRNGVLTSPDPDDLIFCHDTFDRQWKANEALIDEVLEMNRVFGALFDEQLVSA